MTIPRFTVMVIMWYFMVATAKICCQGMLLMHNYARVYKTHASMKHQHRIMDLKMLQFEKLFLKYVET